MDPGKAGELCTREFLARYRLGECGLGAVPSGKERARVNDEKWIAGLDLLAIAKLDCL